jgi:hypothetical protein
MPRKRLLSPPLYSPPFRSCPRLFPRPGPAATLTIHADQPVSRRQPHPLRPHDRGDQLLLRRRPLRGDGPQPHLPQHWDGIQHWYLVEEGNAQAPSRPTRPPAPATPSNPACASTSSRPTRTTRPACSTTATGACPASQHHLQGSFYAKADSPTSAQSPSASSTTRPASPSPPRQSPPSAPTGSSTSSPSRPAQSSPPPPITSAHRRSPRHPLAQPRLALPAHLSRPRQRQPHRPDGEAGRHASGLPALPRRQLS